MSGPAIAALKGGAALAPFSLDGGKFTLTPPPAGTKPTVSANEAECAALASDTENGMGLLYLAHGYGGAAVGYGLVSVDPKLIAAPAPYLGGGVNQDTNPTLPAPTQYRQRLAWVVVVKNVLIYHCPINGCGTVSPTGHGYAVFLLDAQTGTDALLYTEAQSLQKASVSIPVERVSVPWTLESRSPNGYSARVRATVLPCDGVPNPVPMPEGTTTLSVVVERPVGAACGDPKQVSLPLQAATVTSNLPAEIPHGPLGPVVALPPAGNSPSPNETGGVLRRVRDADNGKTLHVNVNDVLAIAPLASVPPDTPSGFVSSDPTVLGSLTSSQNEVGEFRGVETGTRRPLLRARQVDRARGRRRVVRSSAGRPGVPRRRRVLREAERAARQEAPQGALDDPSGPRPASGRTTNASGSSCHRRASGSGRPGRRSRGPVPPTATRT